MKSRWDDRSAAEAVARWARQGVGEDLALRTYSARLLGGEPELVLHGGGNTSVKTRVIDVFGDEVEVLCVKGSGWDLATIEPAGHPAVRLGPLKRLRSLDRLSDEDMVNVQRANLLDQGAPNPSVETLLHAFIPETFIDHTHACAFLAIADQPDATRLIGEIYGDRVACVPYVMPGFELAKRAADAWRPGLIGLALVKHGLFSFAASARESYERMIEMVSLAEATIASRPRIPRSKRVAAQPAAQVLPALRGALTGRWVIDLREDVDARAICDDDRLADWINRGVATPDHVIRTKARPLATPAPHGDLEEWRTQVRSALTAYERDYVSYFERNRSRADGDRTMLDPEPRVIAIPGVGLAALGRSAAEAAVVGDIVGSWARTLLDAEAVGRFEPVSEGDTFDMEYWSLEQAKLGRRARRRLEGHVMVVTGAAGAIGAATARAFAAEGCDLALIDVRGDEAAAVASSISPHALALACDLTKPTEVEATFNQICARFGGMDIVVSNAGAAVTGEMTSLSDEDLRRSFEINFFSHQAVAKAAAACFRLQGRGGVLLFSASKQAFNPGPGFGAYGAAKSALLALMRQYAVELGALGIRVNALNPDRIRSGLLTDEMISARATARGLSETAYMAGNLLGAEVTAEDVAQAFVFAALMEKTTGAVIPVDGGNAAAMPR